MKSIVTLVGSTEQSKLRRNYFIHTQAKKFSPKELGGKQTVGSCSQPPLQRRRRAAGDAGAGEAAACATSPSASPPDPETHAAPGRQPPDGEWWMGTFPGPGQPLRRPKSSEFHL